jgi:ParB family chromosome partitioning protein
METTKKRTALGKGLDALLPLDEPLKREASDGAISYLSLNSIAPNPHQPRRLFSEESLLDLMNSIKEMGVIQPLIVRPKGNETYEIVTGERRWRAARMAGYSTIPAIMRDLSDSESFEIALIENLQREDLNPLDTAEAYETLIRKYSYTHEVLAQRIGKDRTNITNYLRLLKLPDPIKEDIRRERLSMGHARTLLAVDNLPIQMNLSRKVLKQRLSVRELEKIVQNYKKKQKLTPEERPQKDPDLVHLEKNLSRYFTARVVIRRNTNESGKLEITFHSREELLRLLEAMGYSEDFS